MNKRDASIGLNKKAAEAEIVKKAESKPAGLRGVGGREVKAGEGDQR